MRDKSQQNQCKRVNVLGLGEADLSEPEDFLSISDGVVFFEDAMLKIVEERLEVRAAPLRIDLVRHQEILQGIVLCRKPVQNRVYLRERKR